MLGAAIHVRLAAAVTPTLRVWPAWCSRFVLYGIKVRFGESVTHRIVIPIENYPQKRSVRLTDYHPF